MTDCRDEFPASWFRKAKLSPGHRDPSLNYFGVRDVSLSILAVAGASGRRCCTGPTTAD